RHRRFPPSRRLEPRRGREAPDEPTRSPEAPHRAGRHWAKARGAWGGPSRARQRPRVQATPAGPRKDKTPEGVLCRRPSGACFENKIRQRPTLPRGFPRSTIGSGGLNFRVRDGNGCDPSDIATGKLFARPMKGAATLHAKGEISF